MLQDLLDMGKVDFLLRLMITSADDLGYLLNAEWSEKGHHVDSVGLGLREGVGLAS